MSSSGQGYDEQRIGLILREFDRCQRVAFAAACATWLSPTYVEVARLTGLGDPVALQQVVDTAWMLARGESVPRDELDRQRSVAESLVPGDDDDDWSTLSPLTQNSAASAAYAIRSWLTEDLQEAVWAARQLFEAADYLVQLGAPDQSYEEATDPGSPVRFVVLGIDRALGQLREEPVEAVRMQAIGGGLQLRQLWAEGPA